MTSKSRPPLEEQIRSYGSTLDRSIGQAGGRRTAGGVRTETKPDSDLVARPGAARSEPPAARTFLLVAAGLVVVGVMGVALSGILSTDDDTTPIVAADGPDDSPEQTGEGGEPGEGPPPGDDGQREPEDADADADEVVGPDEGPEPNDEPAPTVGDEDMSSPLVVTVEVFSGRPNPTFTLTSEEAALLAETVEGLPPSGTEEQAEEPSGLGFRGFRIQGHQYRGDPMTLIATGEVVILVPPGSVDDESEWLTLADTDGAYDLIKSLAGDHLAPDVMALVP